MGKTGDKSSNLVTLGMIAGVFGVKGWVKVKSFTEPASNLAEYTSLLLKTRHGVKPFQIAEWQSRNKGLLVRFEDIESREDAEALCGVGIAVDKSQLPPLNAGDYYWHQLEGLKVFCLDNGESRYVGNVARLMETGANDVLVVKPQVDSIDERERLIPYVVDHYVKRVCLDEGVIEVLWDPQF